METTEINELSTPEPLKGLFLTETAQYYLQQTAKWAKFLSIMGFIGSGIMVLLGLFFGTFMTAMSRFQPNSNAISSVMGGFMGFFYILIGAFYFFLSFYLYQFADRVKIGVQFQDSLQIEGGFGRLKSLFKITGIITIVCLVLYALIIIGVIIAAVVGYSAMR